MRWLMRLYGERAQGFGKGVAFCAQEVALCVDVAGESILPARNYAGV